MICWFLESFVVDDKLFDDKIVKCLFLSTGDNENQRAFHTNRRHLKVNSETNEEVFNVEDAFRLS